MEKKVSELRRLIEQTLDPYIDRDYVFLDMPYHPNIGDTLIAMAAKNYLKRFPFHCLYYSSEFTFDDRIISPNTLIIFNGGGNFGDLWKNYTVFRNKIISKYPENHFLILPQSVMYEDSKNLHSDIELYSNCPHMTICARDLNSFSFLKEHFDKNNVLLVPDMAFYSDEQLFKVRKGNGKILFLKRGDKEFVNNSLYSLVPQNAEVHDWPTMEREMFPYWMLRQIKRINGKILRHFSKKMTQKIEDLFWQKVLHPYNVKIGIDFVNEYDVIYSTRLHVAVIGFLLGKETYFFDNSYHKNSSLYKTWLEDVKNIHLVNA